MITGWRPARWHRRWCPHDQAVAELLAQHLVGPGADQREDPELGAAAQPDEPFQHASAAAAVRAAADDQQPPVTRTLLRGGSAAAARSSTRFVTQRSHL